MFVVCVVEMESPIIFRKKAVEQQSVGVGGSGRGRCHNSSGVSPVLKPLSVCDLTAALSAAPVLLQCPRPASSSPGVSPLFPESELTGDGADKCRY